MDLETEQLEAEIPITGGRFDLKRKMELIVKVKIIGYALLGEDKEEAEARIALWAEQRINYRPDIRAHLLEIEGYKV